MGYPKELLQEDEEIIGDHIPHWSYVAGAISMVALAVIVTIGIVIVEPVFAPIGLICLLIALLGSVGRIMRWRTTNFTLTNERIIERRGIFAKSGIEIPLDRVTNIIHHQTLIERILGAGTLIVESAGDAGHQRFANVSRPQKLQAKIYKYAQLDSESMSGHTPNGSGNGDSIPEQIEKLDELRNRGLITDDQFEEKKQNLLDKL